MRKNIGCFFVWLIIFASITSVEASIPFIENPSNCSSKIGRGGNYHSSETGKLLGKCQGNAKPPFIKNNEIIFSVPSLMNSKLPIKQENDRTELAFANMRIKFNTPYLIDFKVKVNEDSDVTNSAFYVLQMWQGPKRPPIFGLRIGRGTKDRAAFLIRNPSHSGSGFVLKRTTLGPSFKHFQVYLTIDDQMKGDVNIKENGVQLVKWSGLIGYPETTAQSSFLIKFGIYKEPEKEKSFKVSFKDITIKDLTK